MVARQMCSRIGVSFSFLLFATCVFLLFLLLIARKSFLEIPKVLNATSYCRLESRQRLLILVDFRCSDKSSTGLSLYVTEPPVGCFTILLHKYCLLCCQISVVQCITTCKEWTCTLTIFSKVLLTVLTLKVRLCAIKVEKLTNYAEIISGLACFLFRYQCSTMVTDQIKY